MTLEHSQHGNEQTDSTTTLNKLGAWLDDNTLMRGAFYALVAGVIITLILDYREMLKSDEAIAPVVTPRRANPVLPAFTPPALPGSNEQETRENPVPNITTDSETLNNPMTIELASGGVLKMTGFIDVGTAAKFEQKIADISEYISAIELNSPGGSVFDALEISSKIREMGWTTTVKAGALCASSCPLVLSGGKIRIAEEGAGIGVHQFFSFGEDTRTASEAISGTQATTARITRHLETMEVDSQLWVYALETPPQKLYYFTADELKKYKLVSQ